MVGAPGKENFPSGVNIQGVAYAWKRNTPGLSTSTWTNNHKLVPSDAPAKTHSAGRSVAVSGSGGNVPTIVVGDCYNLAVDLDTNLYGAVYVWEYSSSTWTQTAKLVADVFYNNGRFGESVAIDGNTIVVGEPGSTSASDNGRNGFVHVFTRSVGQTTWTRRAKLTATDGAADDLARRLAKLNGWVGAPLATYTRRIRLLLVVVELVEGPL